MCCISLGLCFFFVLLLFNQTKGFITIKSITISSRKTYSFLKGKKILLNLNFKVSNAKATGWVSGIKTKNLFSSFQTKI